MSASLPSQLIPNSSVEFDLGNSKILIPKASPTFTPWTGTKPSNTYGNKPVLDFNGEPLFAELGILKLMKEAGWDGVWVDSFSKRYARDFNDLKSKLDLPKAILKTLRTINGNEKFPTGCWDVVCWYTNTLIFIEAKRNKKDTIKESQVTWLSKALQTGLRPENFLVTEWSMHPQNDQPSRRNQ